MAQRTVEGILDTLDAARREQVEALRAILREVEPALVEGVKWNAPSYTLHGEDRITFNLANREQLVRLVLHMGVGRPERKGAPPVLDDPAGLVAWSSDIRGLVAFADLADIRARRADVEDVVRRWLAIPVRVARIDR